MKLDLYHDSCVTIGDNDKGPQTGGANGFEEC